MTCLTQFLQQINDKEKIRNTSTKCKVWIFFGSWFKKSNCKMTRDNWGNLDCDWTLEDRNSLFFGVIVLLVLHKK